MGRWIHYGERRTIEGGRFASEPSLIQGLMILEPLLRLDGGQCDHESVDDRGAKMSAVMFITINAETGVATLINKMRGINLTGREAHLK